MKTYTFTEYDLYDLISDARDTISRAKSAKDIIATLTPNQLTGSVVDYSNLIGEWAGSQGFEQFVLDHATVMDNLEKWIANRQGGMNE